jgi:hypothetical protein
LRSDQLAELSVIREPRGIHGAPGKNPVRFRDSGKGVRRGGSARNAWQHMRSSNCHGA